MTAWEAVLNVLVIAAFAMTIYDLVWTVLVPDQRAASHFTRASRGRRVVWVAIIILAVAAVIGWAR